MSVKEQVWAVVEPEILAQIERIRDSVEAVSWVRPSLASVVKSLIKAGLEARKAAIHDDI